MKSRLLVALPLLVGLLAAACAADPTPTPTSTPTPIPTPTQTPTPTPIPRPVASFSVDVSSGSAALNVQFSDSSDGPVTAWEWDFGDGSSSTERNPAHEYTLSGTHTVQLTVSGPGGSDSSTLAESIQVEPAALAAVSVSPALLTLGVLEASALSAQALDAYGNELDDATFEWEVPSPSGSIDLAGRFTAGTEAGTFEGLVRVVASSGGQAVEAAVDVVVVPGPMASVVLEPQEVTLDIGGSQEFTVSAFDEFGNEIVDVLSSWINRADVGVMDASGVLTTGTLAGAFPQAIQVQVVHGLNRLPATADVSIRPDPLATIELQPSCIVVDKGADQQFTAGGFDQYRNEIPGLALLWEATGGQIDQAGLFTAGGQSGRYQVAASATLGGSTATGSAECRIPPWMPTFTVLDTQPGIARSGTEMVYDAARGVMVLFSGAFGGGFSVNDTWEYNGISWRQVVTSQAPSPRWSHAMAYDSNRQRTVLFGGQDGARVFGDTWEYDGSDWKRITPVSSPTPRSSGTMVFDSCRNRMVLFGGAGFVETWEYDGADWTRATPNASPPGGTHLAGMAFDSARCKVVLFGGSPAFEGTWEYDGVTWTNSSTTASPSFRWGHEMAYDPSRQRIVLFGGYSPLLNSTLNDTWEYDGSDWVQVNIERGPGPTEQLAMAYDSSRERILMLIRGNTYGYILAPPCELPTPDPPALGKVPDSPVD